MSKRFGLGEYERVDYQIPPSKTELQFEFLKLLLARKPICFSRLVGWVEGRSGDKSKSPLLRYCHFVKRDTSRIEAKSRELLSRGLKVRDSHLLRLALQELHGSWKELAKREEATDFLASLDLWGQKLNLIDPWCKEVAVSVLISELSRFQGSNPSDLHSRAMSVSDIDGEILRDYHRFDVLRQALLDWREFRLQETWYIAEEGESQTFSFPVGKWRYEGRIWHPEFQYESEFREETLVEFKELKQSVLDYFESNSAPPLAHEGEFTATTGDGQESSTLLVTLHKNQLACIEGPIDPDRPFFRSSFSTKEYPDESLNSLYSLLKEPTKSKSTNADIAAALGVYIDQIRSRLLEAVKRTPRMNTETRHMDWLVEYQVPPYNSYSAIAKAHKVSPSTVRSALSRISVGIDLTLRESKKTGRPSGIVEFHKREKRQK